MSDESPHASEAGGQAAALLDRAIGAALADGTAPFLAPNSLELTSAIWSADEALPTTTAINAVNRVGLSVSVGAARRCAMTVSGRIDGPPERPGFDPVQAQAVCTISDRNAPDEAPLQGTLRLAEDGSFTFTVLLEAWPEERYPQGRLFVITVRARDRAGALGTSTTYLRVPPPAPLTPAPRQLVKPLRAMESLANELLADAAARRRTTASPLYVKGLHLAVKELREEQQGNPVRAQSVPC